MRRPLPLQPLNNPPLNTNIPPRIDMRHPDPAALAKVAPNGIPRVRWPVPVFQRRREGERVRGVERRESEGRGGLGAAGQAVAD